MKWSWKLFRFAGIDVYMHATFLLIIGFVAMQHWMLGQGLRGVIEGVGFVLALFACVVAHEFGHALTARRYGIRTRDITLLPIGGVARLERMPDDPIQELWVALAGPAVNVVIAVGLFVWLAVTSALQPYSALTLTAGPFLQRLMVVNVFLVVFNMLPAFPMDGGRVLRALLATRMEYTRATQTAATLGQGMALLFGFLGLFWNPFLVFIALFVWIGAAQEASMVKMKSAMSGIPVGRAMITDFRSLLPNDTLAHAVELILTGTQQDFPVVDDTGQVVGVLTRADLLKALASREKATPVSEIMQRRFMHLDPGEMLETAFLRLQECQCQTMLVTRGGELVGLVTRENLGEFLMIHAAFKKKALRSATA